MDPDQVFSQLSDQINALSSKVDDNSSRFDALNANLQDLKSSVVAMQSSAGSGGSGDMQAALTKVQSDLAALSTTVSGMQPGVAAATQATQQTQGLLDETKKIEDANAAAQQAAQAQAGLIGKLQAQVDDATKMIGNWPNTALDIANKAVADGKQAVLNQIEQTKTDVLNIWTSSKADIMNSISGVTTPLINNAITSVKQEITDGIKDTINTAKQDIIGDLKSMVSDDVKEAAPPPPTLGPLATLTKDELDAMIHDAVKLGIANTPA